MLNGISPIMLFNFIKLSPAPTSISKIPIISDILLSRELNLLLPIPVYLDEKLTGLCIQTESKNVDIDTDTVTLTESTSDLINNQKGIASTVTIVMKARRGSIGIALLSALIDVVFKKVTSREYSITYLHGDVILFGALLHGFEINETEDNDLSEIKITLIDPGKQKATASISNIGKSLQTGIAAVHP